MAEEGFCFDFGGESLPLAGDGATTAQGVWPEPSALTSNFPWLSRWEVTGSSASQAAPSTSPLVLTCSSHTTTYHLCYQTPPNVNELTSCQSDADKKKVDHRDIIQGHYYGGLKVWSCAYDLARYLIEHEEEFRPILSSAAVVVEVGCGQALPGLAAMCLGAQRLILQDYNEEVLQSCTLPNTAATIHANPSSFALQPECSPSVKLIYGDWVDLQWHEPAGGCDVILGSDVTFDFEACRKLSLLLHRWLTVDTGFAIIATKPYYFGTNGGETEFIACVRQYSMKVEKLLHIKDGSSMERLILKVTKVSS